MCKRLSSVERGSEMNYFAMIIDSVDSLRQVEQKPEVGERIQFTLFERQRSPNPSDKWR